MLRGFALGLRRTRWQCGSDRRLLLKVLTAVPSDEMAIAVTATIFGRQVAYLGMYTNEFSVRVVLDGLIEFHVVRRRLLYTPRLRVIHRGPAFALSLPTNI